LLRGGAACRGQTLVEYALLLAFVASMVVALGYVVGGFNGEGGLANYIIDGIVNNLS
jgi:hypothetical protein